SPRNPRLRTLRARGARARSSSRPREAACGQNLRILEEGDPVRTSTRRSFLHTLASGATATCIAPAFLRSARAEESASRKKKVAFLGTEVRTHSHAQHFLDRMTLGYGWGGKWQEPRVEVASVYIDQCPERDLARGRIERHALRRFDTIADALTLGTGELAVDGVVIIAEHGKYPKNEKGQTLYPRYEWLK